MAVLLIDGLSGKNIRVQTAIRAIELLLLSAGLISIFLTLKKAAVAVAPCSYDMVFLTLKKNWFYFKGWLSYPLYTCIIMTLIVIFIAASSLFPLHHHPHKTDNNNYVSILIFGENEDDDFLSIASPPSLPSFSPPSGVAPPPVLVKNSQNHLQNTKKREAEAPLATETASTAEEPTSFQNHHCHRICEDSESQNCTIKTEYLPFSDVPYFSEAKEIRKAHSHESSAQVLKTEKILQPTIPKEGKEKSDGKQKQFEETKEHLETKGAEGDDTMEATWRAITGGGAKPQKKQLKKSETWAQPPRVVPVEENLESEPVTHSTPAFKVLKTSLTFNDTISIMCRGGLRRDPSMSREEFNARVEASINKFKNDLRLQRQDIWKR